MKSACRCRYQEFEHDDWLTGTAITNDFGVFNVHTIVGDNGDILTEVYNYKLDWTHSIDGGALAAKEKLST